MGAPEPEGMGSERIVIRQGEPFQGHPSTCLHGDPHVWDWLEGRDGGDFAVSLVKDAKIVGGMDLSTGNAEYLAMPGDRKKNPIFNPFDFNWLHLVDNVTDEDVERCRIKLETVQIEEAIGMTDCASINCYGHYMLEFAPMFSALGTLSDNDLGSLPILTPEFRLCWQTRAMAFLDIEHRRIACEHGKIYEIKRLWNVSRPHNSIVPSWVPGFLKEAFRCGAKQAPTRRLFVSRQRVMHARRKIVNYHDVISTLAPYGFEEVHPQEMDIASQVELFSGASSVLGVHGSGMLNFVFCPPGTTMIEAIPEGWPCHYGRAACAANRGEYRYFTIKGGQGDDFVIDCDILDKVLRDTYGLPRTDRIGGKMHSSVMKWVEEQVAKHGCQGQSVLEVGSMNVNGSVRPLFEKAGASSYIGVDMRDGIGVDCVMNARALGFPDGHFDWVVCTEMLEHDSEFWTSMREMGRVLRPGGKLMITTRGNGFPLHGYPSDYWRFMPGAVEPLLGLADCEMLEGRDDLEFPGIFGMGRKKTLS